MANSAAPIRVAVVEDHRSERETLAAVLRKSAGLEFVAACSSTREAIEVLPGCSPDIVLMDINMPGGSGIECVRRLCPLMPKTQFMMLTVVEDHEKIFDSLRVGATGYLLKSETSARLVEAIRELHSGGAPMSGQIARQVIAAFKPPVSIQDGERLTPMGERVLDLLARGLPYKEISDELGVSISTVRTHICRIYKKLHANNRTQAVRNSKRFSSP